MTEPPADKKTKILIVEDEAVICMHIQNSLERLGYEVCGCVNSGPEAIRIAGECIPDLILMDIVLQGDMDGIEAAKTVKDRFGIPVVYMTGNADIPTITRARASDPYGYILKPIDVLHMFSTIDTILHRRDLELRLAESEEKFRAISENIQEGIALTVDFRNEWVNDTFAAIFGYTKEEMVGRGPEMVIHPEDLMGVMKIGRDMMKGMPTGFHRVRAVRKDGSEIMVELNGRLLKINSSTAILLIVRNVTERVRAEAALRESEEKYRALVEEINDVIISLDAKGSITFASASVEALLGYAPNDLQGRSIMELVYPEDVEPVVGRADARMRGIAGTTEFRVVAKSGTPIWVRASGKPIVVNGVFNGIRGALTNIDEKKRAEEALRISENQYRSITTNLPGVVYQFYARDNGENGLYYVDERARDLWEIEIEPLDSFMQRFTEQLHPDDRDGFLSSISEAVRTVGTWDWEGRYLHPGGREIWFRGISRPVRAGNEVVFNGLMLDITDRKIAEMKMQDSEVKFRSLMQNIQDIVLIMDREGIIVFENPATKETLGYSLMGRRGFDIVHPEDLKTAAEAFSEVLDNKNKHTPTMFRVRHADGSWLYVEALATSLFDNSVIPGMLLVCRDVTSRIEAQAALRESEERYRALFDQSPVGVFLFDKDLVITECNDRFADIVRRRREEILGFCSAELKDSEVIRKMRETLKGNPSSWEGWFIAPDTGSRFYHSTYYSPLRDAGGKVVGGIAVVNDLTERKNAEEQLLVAEERSRILIENANESIVVIQDWRFIFVNPKFVQLTGFTADELAARRFTEFVHPEDREQIAGRYVKRLEGDTSSLTYEVRFVDRDGDIKWTEVNSVMIIWEKKPAALLFIRDISERKRAEEERTRIEAQIQQTQKLESLGVLAGGIAHDFNNLLMAILGNIDLAFMDLSPSSPARGNLMEAAKASQRAADLCRQMLAYSGRGRFTSEALDLNEVIEDMEHMLEVSISKKAVVRYNFSSGIPAIEADVTQVRQIIMNLVINASDAIAQKSGVISVSTGVMSCDQAYLSETWLNENLPEGMYVYIEVADTGSGIPNGELQKIFDPFYTTKFTGRGLGLAAVLGIVRGHRGAIKVYSEIGKGTAFKVLFPAADRNAEPISWSRDVGDDWHGSGPILLVDDEETIRVLGKRMLERFGFTALTAENGSQAIEIFRDNPDGIRCVIMDLTMPHMDGEEAFRELRRIRKDACVIMSSGYNEQEINQRFAGKGIAGFIQKPYQMADLAAKLKKILG
ncbi:MAG: PAS domain S-box protein [Spirochaetes bacterium]|nr:PAS domain S-box protein [Spirochaetota bacterium]